MDGEEDDDDCDYDQIDDDRGDEPAVNAVVEDEVYRFDPGGDEGVDDGQNGCEHFQVDENVDELYFGSAWDRLVDGWDEGNESQRDGRNDCQLFSKVVGLEVYDDVDEAQNPQRHEDLEEVDAWVLVHRNPEVDVLEVLMLLLPFARFDHLFGGFQSACRLLKIDSFSGLV
jgi:hypothetical protein